VKLGMNMLLWSTDVAGNEYHDTFAMVQDAGFDGVEIPIFDPEPTQYERLGRRLDALGLEKLAVGARNGDTNPLSADAEMRARALDAAKAELDACAALGASRICGPLEAPLAVFTGAPATDDERKRAVEHLRATAEYAEPRGVTLVVEYLNRFEMYLVNTAAQTAALVREVDHPNCRMMYDTFHAHIEEKDPRAAIHACRDVLVHVHLSENDRSTPGHGQIDWETTIAALKEIGYDNWYVIEAFGDRLPELAGATRIWRRMFESEEQLARDGAEFARSLVESR
jgi:D-psicose/D-tagatose/L-ribulose 3-epimerase